MAAAERGPVRLAVIGTGLIGGSLALAARTRLGARVTGHDSSPGALDAAARAGALDARARSLGEAVRDADVVVLAAPVGPLPELVRATLAAAPAGAVVTDAGSTKRAVVAAAGTDPRFCGGHPLAGAETAGAEHARADLFDGATWYLTPTEHTDGEGYERLHRLLTAIGARPLAVEAPAHDALMASVSHLPHVLANVLVGGAAAALGGQTLPRTGPSFRDATRVAGANTPMWTDIYLANADALAAAIDDATARLERFRAALARGDRAGIAAWNDAAAADRRRLLEVGLHGGAVHALRVVVPNEPGVVARLALALGRAHVNIADMALDPAPDRRSGSVTLWVAGDDAAEQAAALVRDLGFPVARA